jgi:hypothetical protein
MIARGVIAGLMATAALARLLEALPMWTEYRRASIDGGTI